MSNFDIRKFLIENKLTQVSQLVKESELEDLGVELADALEDEFKKRSELEEFVDPVSILATVIASNTFINILSKYISRLFKKYDFGTGEQAAKSIYNFTHKLEDDFKIPIERVVGMFTKNTKVKNLVTNGLFILLLLGLGSKAGAEAFEALKDSDTVAGGLSSLKAALKGRDVTVVAKAIAAAKGGSTG